MHRLPVPAALAVVVLAGAGVGLQGRVNGELASRLHSALEAAALSFVIGLVMLVVVLPGRSAAVGRLRRAGTRWWWFLSGLGGAALVSSSAHAVPRIGVALTSVCLVAGTTAGALATDSFGLGPSGRHPATGWRLAGALIAIGAVGVSSIGGHGSTVRPLVFLLLIAAGAGSAVQQAANGQLRGAAQDTVVAATISFLGGTVALVVAVLATGQLHPSHWPAAPWVYLGGPLGVAYIAIGAAIVQRIGVLRLALATVAGQLLAAVLLDAVWPEPGTSLRPATVVGAVLTLVGVQLSGRGRREPTPAEAVADP